MCGPADFAALQTSLTRLAGLWLAGVGAYLVYKASSLYRQRRLNQAGEEKGTVRKLLRRPAVVSSSER